MLSDGTPHETVADLRRVAEEVIALAVVGADKAKTLVVPGDADARLARAALAAELASLGRAAGAAGVAGAGLRERRGGLRERGRGFSRGGLRSAIFGCVSGWHAVEPRCQKLSSERHAAQTRFEDEKS